ncbi:VIT1/CCC1 transporter family protein [Bremerella sp.]|uniref:VIT1/CCC1 transporter family protein n=1 Tax=Bremerella sp. TaxID=2795602 RepID=UPI00391920D9
MKLSPEELAQQHTDEAIAARIAGPAVEEYSGDFVLGGVDGTITTFAIVAGVAGASYGVTVAMVLGIANLLADGFSMAISNYLKARSDQMQLQKYRQIENIHIKEVPDREREEIRQIFAGKGFDGELLEQVVETICEDRRRWVDTMLVEEWGLRLQPPSPWKSGLVTFTGFVLCGSIPLLPLPLIYLGLNASTIFLSSAILTCLAFALIGVFRARVVQEGALASVVETVVTGGVAAAIAYGVGVLLDMLAGSPAI